MSVAYLLINDPVNSLEYRFSRAYFHSASTLNYIRALLSSGFADLHQPRNWSFSHVHSPQLQKAFEEVIDSLMDSLDFMRSATGGSAPGGGRGGTETVDFYTRSVERFKWIRTGPSH